MNTASIKSPMLIPKTMRSDRALLLTWKDSSLAALSSAMPWRILYVPAITKKDQSCLCRYSFDQSFYCTQSYFILQQGQLTWGGTGGDGVPSKLLVPNMNINEQGTQLKLVPTCKWLWGFPPSTAWFSPAIFLAAVLQLIDGLEYGVIFLNLLYSAVPKNQR